MTLSLRRNRILIACLAALTLALGVSSSADAAARGFKTGILDIDAYVDIGNDLAFKRTQEAGATYVKTNLYWNQIAPDSPTQDFAPRNPADSNYSNWGPIDHFVEEAEKNNLVPILDITNAPEFARNPAACTNAPECSPLPAEYANFAAAVANRYSGRFVPADSSSALPRVTYFQAWVEPNLNFFYKPTFKNGQPVAPTNYRGILNAFYDAVKSVNRSNIVISAGLAPLARPNATIGPLDFMRRLLCLKGRANPKPGGCSVKTKLDIWATHPYTTGGPTHEAPGPDDVSLGDLPDMGKTLRAADRFKRIQKTTGGKTPFWVTEFSWDSKPPDPGGLKMSIHSRWVAEAMYRMYKADVDTLIWFGLRDENKGSRSNAEVYQSGFYIRGASIAGDKPKRSLQAFKFPFVALKTNAGFHFWGRTPKSTPAQIKIQVDNGPGGFRTVGTIKPNREGVFEGNVKQDGISPSANVQAVAAGQGKSLPFSLKYVKDFYQPPFGGRTKASRAGARIDLTGSAQTPRPR